MRLPTIASLLILASAAAANAQTVAEPYRAIGTEPFWSVTLNGKTIRVERPGHPVLTVASPEPEVGFNGELYLTRTVMVDITHVPCSDGMSDRTFPDTVMLRVNGTVYRGCGGAPAGTHARASLLDGDWRIEALFGRPVSRETRPTISFRGGRVSGNASCNNFSGSFRFVRGRLTVGPLASTRKFCSRRVQNVQESNILDLLGAPLSVSSYRRKLVLTGKGGKSMVLAPAERR